MKSSFFKNLEKTKLFIDWGLTSKGKIRGSLKGNPSKRFCPLTAVYLLKTLQYRPMAFAYDSMCGENIVSGRYTEYQVTEAADTKTNEPELRFKILKAVGLTQ